MALGRALLMILDGWGLAKDSHVSAVKQAQTPFFDSCWSGAPHACLLASGEAVGLPIAQMGNSEVGHMHIGAGRVVEQDLVRIDKAAASGGFVSHPKLCELFAYAKQNKKQLHFMGLFSTGGVHAHLRHLEALATAAQQAGITHSYLHAFLDGRDMPPCSALELMGTYLDRFSALGLRLSSCMGRYYAMDRDRRWERTLRAYRALTAAEGLCVNDPYAMLERAYGAGITDEFLEPHLLVEKGSSQGPKVLREGDVVVCFNYRPDRMRQLVQVLSQYPPKEVPAMQPMLLKMATLTSYDDRFEGLVRLFEKEPLYDTLGEVISVAQRTQLRIAETEKYPHVTYFFSGGKEQPFVGETRILCPSPSVATYDQQPEMSAAAINTKLLPLLADQRYDFVCLNYANPDMVGHTGVFSATVRACEEVDRCAAQVATTARSAGYHVLIIADHGNAECMLLPDGTPHTAHTNNLVPCILLPATASTLRITRMYDGSLVDVAPTLLALMDLKQPIAMTGHVLYE